MAEPSRNAIARAIAAHLVEKGWRFRRGSILPSPMRNSGPGHERMAPADHMLRFEAEIIRAEWNWARAAACPWWSPVRRWCLVQRAQSCDRAAAMHFELAGQAARTHA